VSESNYPGDWTRDKCELEVWRLRHEISLRAQEYRALNEAHTQLDSRIQEAEKVLKEVFFFVNSDDRPDAKDAALKVRNFFGNKE